MTPVTLNRDDAIGPDAADLIRACAAEMEAVYPPENCAGLSREELIAAGAAMFVARRGGRALGCGAVASMAGYAELKRIYARPEARGTGVVQPLLRALESQAREWGLPVLRLETGVLSPAAMRAYARAGFVERGPFGAYTDTTTSVYMEKPL